MEDGARALEQNGKRVSYKELVSRMQREVRRAGAGEAAQAGDRQRKHFLGLKRSLCPPNRVSVPLSGRGVECPFSLRKGRALCAA